MCITGENNQTVEPSAGTFSNNPLSASEKEKEHSTVESLSEEAGPPAKKID